MRNKSERKSNTPKINMPKIDKKIILLITCSILVIFILFGIFVKINKTQKQEEPDKLKEIEKAEKLVVGVKFDARPFSYKNEKGELVGFDIDLAKKIAETLLGDKNKIEFKEATPSKRILMLNSNQVDIVVASMSITTSRKQIVNFSKPYYIAGQAILVPKSSNITTIPDLNNKRVIVIHGSTAETNLKIVAPKAKIIGFKTYTEGFNALKAHQAEAMATDDTIIFGFLETNNNFKILPKRYTQEPYAVAVKKGEKYNNLLSKIDFLIETMQHNGELRNLRNEWIKY
ncbi:MAG: transporter substrate-binding domain-containing protein [bacterium]|nr:transporter substrate-binding domain-containing protein [bacterium]